MDPLNTNDLLFHLVEGRGTGRGYPVGAETISTSHTMQLSGSERVYQLRDFLATLLPAKGYWRT